MDGNLSGRTGPREKSRARRAETPPRGAEQLLVIGAGFIGSRVAAAALDRRLPLLVLSRGVPLEPGLGAAGVRVVIGDAADRALVTGILSTGSHVVYCAGGRLPTGSVDDPVDDAVETLRPLINVLQALRTVPGGRLTYLSSGGTVYGRPLSEPIDEDHPCRPVVPYGVSRLAAEGYVGAYAATYGIRSRVLRLGNVYGATQPSDRRQGVVAALLAAAREHRPVPIFGDGSIARDYVHVDDVADVILRLPPPADVDSVLNVGTGVARTLREVIDIAQNVTGVTLRLVRRPDRPFDVRRIALSIRRLSELIPFAPMPLEEGIRRAWLEQPEAAVERATPGS
jgi:UDP-glucose 4-epimerase